VHENDSIFKTSSGNEGRGVISIKENVQNEKECYVKQNKELMRIRAKF
jgi:hypothetical protein